MYRGSDFPAEKQKAWVVLVNKVVKRDKYTCQACRRKFVRKALTGHHIIPRDEGGPDELPNLITLCVPCHTFIELSELRSWDDIIGCTEGLDLSDLTAREIKHPEPSKTDERLARFAEQAGRMFFTCPTCGRKFAREYEFMQERAHRIIKCTCGSWTIYERETNRLDWREVGIKPSFLIQEGIDPPKKKRGRKPKTYPELPQRSKKEKEITPYPDEKTIKAIREKYLVEYAFNGWSVHIWIDNGEHTLCDNRSPINRHACNSAAIDFRLNRPVRWCQLCLKKFQMFRS